MNRRRTNPPPHQPLVIITPMDRPSILSIGVGIPGARQHPYLGIHAVNVFVRDQERSLRFYVDKLGFEIAFDAQVQSGQRWIAVSPPDGTAVLALIAPEPGSLQHKLIGRATQVVLVTDDVPGKFR